MPEMGIKWWSQSRPTCKYQLLKALKDATMGQHFSLAKLKSGRFAFPFESSLSFQTNDKEYSVDKIKFNPGLKIKINYTVIAIPNGMK